jgi:hypothetical protein
MKKTTIILILTLLALVLSLFFETSPIKANVYVENSWLSKTSMNVARSDLGVALALNSNFNIIDITFSSQASAYRDILTIYEEI